MSTRCHIVIKEKGFGNVYIYHHCDGDPGGVGSEIVWALAGYQKYTKEFDLKWSIKGVSEEILRLDDEYKEDYEIHGDEDYIYEIDCDNRTVKCYAGEYYDEKFPGDEIVIPGNKDFTACNEEKKEYSESYRDTLTRVTCALIPINKESPIEQIVSTAKSITDEIIKNSSL